MNRLHHGKVIGSKFVPHDKKAFAKNFELFEGKDVSVGVSLRKNKRTTPQNSYLWGVVYKLASEFTGYDSGEIHDAMKVMFLFIYRGKGLKTIRSTSSLSTVEFEEYVENVRRYWITEWELIIPLPNEMEI